MSTRRERTRTIHKHTINSITIQLTQGYEAQVSVSDCDLAELRWHVLIAHGDRNLAYAKRQIGGRKAKATILLHRLIMERVLGRKLEKGEQVDHKDGNTLNNQRENLRVATISENHHNTRRPSTNTSGYKGVRKNTKIGNRFVSRIFVNGKNLYLGTFDTVEEAHETYSAAAVKHFGEFARAE